jgi:hypothetical protein
MRFKVFTMLGIHTVLSWVMTKRSTVFHYQDVGGMCNDKACVMIRISEYVRANVASLPCNCYHKVGLCYRKGENSATSRAGLGLSHRLPNGYFGLFVCDKPTGA